MTNPVHPRVRAREALLARASVRVAQRAVVHDGVRTAFLEAGEGPPIVLVHGADGGAVDWYRMLAPLARHHRVIAPDVLGYGESDKPADAAYDRACFADWLTGFLEAAGIGPAVLVGSSQGGAIAISVALQAPRRVSKLVLVGSAGLGDFRPRDNLVGMLAMLAQNVIPTRAMVRFTAPYLVDREEALPDELVTYFVEVLRSGATRVFWRGRGRAVARFSPDELAQLSMPTLLVWGEHDRVFPLAWAERAQSAIGRARLEVLPGSRHLPYLDRPDALAQLVVSFAAEGAEPQLVVGTPAKGGDPTRSA